MFICEHQCPWMSATATLTTPGSITGDFDNAAYGILFNLKFSTATCRRHVRVRTHLPTGRCARNTGTEDHRCVDTCLITAKDILNQL